MIMIYASCLVYSMQFVRSFCPDCRICYIEYEWFSLDFDEWAYPRKQPLVSSWSTPLTVVAVIRIDNIYCVHLPRHLTLIIIIAMIITDAVTVILAEHRGRENYGRHAPGFWWPLDFEIINLRKSHSLASRRSNIICITSLARVLLRRGVQNSARA